MNGERFDDGGHGRDAELGGADAAGFGAAGFGVIDDRVLQRYLDGELSAGHAAFVERRLSADAELRARCAEQRSIVQLLGAARGVDRRAPAGFTAAVVAAARRLPDRQQLERADLTANMVRLCRRLLMAAALVAGAGLLWRTGLLDAGHAGTVQAAPDEVRREIERMDALLIGSPAAGAGAPQTVRPGGAGGGR